MTSPTQRAFEAWATEKGARPHLLRKTGSYFDTYLNRDWKVWQAALASRDKLRDAVIILEDGTEPEIDDTLEYDSMNMIVCSDGFEHVSKRAEHQFIWLKHAKTDVDFGNAKIIRRNNKPVIYRSELEKV